jgi:hypothetical protein
MTKETLEAILAKHGMKVDDSRGGAGKFRDLYIGTGQPIEKLVALWKELCAADGCFGLTKITTVTNKEHPDHGKLMLEVGSFWWE